MAATWRTACRRQIRWSADAGISIVTAGSTFATTLLASVLATVPGGRHPHDEAAPLIDWVLTPARTYRRRGIPFGAAPNHSEIPATPADTAMIYPNPAKDVDSTEYPYAELFRTLPQRCVDPIRFSSGPATALGMTTSTE